MGLDKKSMFLDTFTGKEPESVDALESLAVGSPQAIAFVFPINPFAHLYVSSQL